MTNTLKLNARLLGLTVTLGGMLLLPTILVPAPSDALPTTTFACIKKGSDPVTVARRGDRITSPMITWRDKTWGSYTPEKRCQLVSQRLTKAVATSGKLSSLDMTYGLINSLPVICYITTKGEKCNSDNILFSLKASERGQEQRIVNELLNFSKLGSGAGTVRGGATVTSPTPQTYGDAIENAFNQAAPADIDEIK
jgi:Circadian oscillating protein COP23